MPAKGTFSRMQKNMFRGAMATAATMATLLGAQSLAFNETVSSASPQEMQAPSETAVDAMVSTETSTPIALTPTPIPLTSTPVALTPTGVQATSGNQSDSVVLPAKQPVIAVTP